MTTTKIDYATTYFPHSSPTPIRGEPSYKALKKLKNELRANASSVDSDLGGGDYGYLGLILSEEEYQRICANDPFEAPEFPGRLLIPRGTDTADALNLREEHRNNVAQYRECREVEKALLRHITTAVESRYIDFLKNEDTDLVEDDIPTVLTYLFTNYGKVPTREVKEKEREVLDTSFVPSDPMVTIYRPIEQLRTLAQIAKIPYTESQIVDFGIHLIKNTRDFETALGEWNRKTSEDKTWKIFKSHFQAAQQALKDIRGPTMHQSGFHHANHLASEIREEIRGSHMQMLALAKVAHISEEEEEEPFEPHHQVANNANMMLQHKTAEILQSLQKDLQLLTQQLKDKGTTPRIFNKTSDNPTFKRDNTSKYCWTHGACNHASNECSRKAPGHNVDATKTIKLGGSKAFCA